MNFLWEIYVGFFSIVCEGLRQLARQFSRRAAMVVMAVMTALCTWALRFTYDSWLPYTRSADTNGFAIWCFCSLTLLNR